MPGKKIPSILCYPTGGVFQHEMLPMDTISLLNSPDPPSDPKNNHLVLEEEMKESIQWIHEKGQIITVPLQKEKKIMTRARPFTVPLHKEKCETFIPRTKRYLVGELNKLQENP